MSRFLARLPHSRSVPCTLFSAKSPAGAVSAISRHCSSLRACGQTALTSTAFASVGPNRGFCLTGSLVLPCSPRSRCSLIVGRPLNAAVYSTRSAPCRVLSAEHSPTAARGAAPGIRTVAVWRPLCPPAFPLLAVLPSIRATTPRLSPPRPLSTPSLKVHICASLSHMPTARTLRHARPLKAARASRRTLPTDARSDRGRAGQQLRTARLLPRLRVRPPAAPSQLVRSLIRPHEGRRKGPVRQYARSPATELSERHLLASMGRAMGTPSRARAEQSHPARRERACAH